MEKKQEVILKSDVLLHYSIFIRNMLAQIKKHSLLNVWIFIKRHLMEIQFLYSGVFYVECLIFMRHILMNLIESVSSNLYLVKMLKVSKRKQNPTDVQRKLL